MQIAPEVQIEAPEDFTSDYAETPLHKLFQNGKEVYKFAVQALPKSFDLAAAKAGLTKDDIDHALQGNSPFFEHPMMDPVHGIEFSGGSLGQGLSLGMGTALGLKKKGLLSPKIYVIVGDGECDEGQVWEAAAAVTHFGLNSVTVIVDDNGLQFDGRKEDILKSGDAAGRWKSLGFDVVTVDGHDVEALRNALRREVPDRPKVVIAKTVKGKGVHFAENDVTWHTGRLTDELYQEAIRDIND
jgi:transketolase